MVRNKSYIYGPNQTSLSIMFTNTNLKPLKSLKSHKRNISWWRRWVTNSRNNVKGFSLFFLKIPYNTLIYFGLLGMKLMFLKYCCYTFLLLIQNDTVMNIHPCIKKKNNWSPKVMNAIFYWYVDFMHAHQSIYWSILLMFDIYNSQNLNLISIPLYKSPTKRINLDI